MLKRSRKVGSKAASRSSMVLRKRGRESGTNDCGSGRSDKVERLTGRRVNRVWLSMNPPMWPLSSGRAEGSLIGLGETKTRPRPAWSAHSAVSETGSKCSRESPKRSAVGVRSSFKPTLFD
jgi:hypothetical protein